MSSRLEMIEKMLAAGSTEAFHWYARAMELRSLDRLEDALGAYADVREKFPDYVPTYLMAAQVAQELERDDDAARRRGEARTRRAEDLRPTVHARGNLPGRAQGGDALAENAERSRR